MAIKFPDILVHNNIANPLMASTSSKGTAYPINNLEDTGSIDTNKRQEGHIVFVTGSQEFYGFAGTGSGEWDKPENWKKLSEWDGNLNSDASITGSFTVSGSDANVDFTNVTAVSASIFSGSFVGDGSGITGISSTPVTEFRVFVTGSGTNSINTVNGSNVSNDTFSNLLGGEFNRSTGDYSSVVGGQLNSASADFSIVGAGKNNSLARPAASSSILGGFNNSSSFTNTHILGSNITADKANYSYVNNISIEGIASGSTFSGSFVGDGSGLTSLSAEWNGSRNGDSSITGSLTVSGSTSIVDFTNVAAISGSNFSGSFEGDGSGLTGVAATSIAFSNITSIPTLVSSSNQFNSLTAPFTGSFTGSFSGSFNGTAAPAGTNTQIQFNNSGVLGASSLFTFTNSDTVTIGDISTSNTNGQIHLKENDNETTAILINGNSELKLYRTTEANALTHNGTTWKFDGSTASTTTTTGAVIVDGGVGIAGDLNVGGTITSTKVVSNIVSQSIALATGSNIFGDNTADNHEFTGSVSITGSLEASQGFMILTQVSESLNFSDDSAAATGGVPLGGLYRSGNFIAIRLS